MYACLHAYPNLYLLISPLGPGSVAACTTIPTCVVVQDVTPGKIAFTKPTSAPEEAQEQVALFKPADLRESSLKLRPGDKVEFSIVQQETVPEDLATDVILVSRASASGGADGKPLMGCIISVKAGFGFIRCASLQMSYANAMQPYAVCKGSSVNLMNPTLILILFLFFRCLSHGLLVKAKSSYCCYCTASFTLQWCCTGVTVT